MRTYALIILTLTTACGGDGAQALSIDGGAGFAGEAGSAGVAGSGSSGGVGGSTGGTAGSAGSSGSAGVAGAASIGGVGGVAGAAGTAGGGASGSAGSGGIGGSCTTPTCNWVNCPWDMADPKLKGFVPCCMTECGPCGYRDNTGTPSDVCFAP